MSKEVLLTAAGYEVDVLQKQPIQHIIEVFNRIEVWGVWWSEYSHESYFMFLKPIHTISSNLVGYTSLSKDTSVIVGVVTQVF